MVDLPLPKNKQRSSDEVIIPGMTAVADNPVIIPDRDLEEEKKTRNVGTAARPLPALRLVAPQGRQMVL